MAEPDGIVWDDAPAPSHGAAAPDDSIQWDAPPDFSNVRSGAMSQLAAPEPSWWDKTKAKASEIGDNLATGAQALVEGGDYQTAPNDKRALIGVPEGLARETYDVLSGFADSTLKATNPLAAPLIDQFMAKGHAALGNDEETTRFASPRAEFAARAIPDFIANLVPMGEGAKAMGEIATEGRASQAFEPALKGELGPDAQGAATAHAVMDEAEQTVKADTAGIADVAPPEVSAVPPAAAAEHPATAVDAAASPIDVPPEAAPAAPVADVAPDRNPITERFAEKLNDHPAAAEEYAAIPETQGGTVLNTDVARELSPDYLNDRTKSADVHEPASAFVKKLYAEKLDQPTPEGKDATVLFTAGGTGAGKTTGLAALGDRIGKPEIVYDTNMNKYSSAKQKVEQALAAGRDVKIAYTYRDPAEALRNGALKRAKRQEGEFGTGRTVPMDEHLKTHVGAYDVVNKLAEEYHGDSRVQILAVDNSRGNGKATRVPLENVPDPRAEDLYGRLQDQLDQAHANGEISDSIYRGFRGEAPRALDARAEGSPAAEAGRPAQAAFGERPGNGRNEGVDGSVRDGVEPQDARRQPVGEPQPAAVRSQPESVTGIKNAQVAQERANLGLEAVKHDLARTDKAAWAAEEARSKEHPTYGRDLADSLIAKPRAVSKEEVFALTIDRARIRNERREAYAQAEKALDAGDTETAAAWRARTDRLDEEMEKNDIAGRLTGHEQAEGLRARQRMAKEDYSMAALVQRAKVRKGEALTAAEKAKWEGIAKDIEKREAALAERERALQEAKTKPRTRAAAEAKTRFDTVAEKLRNSARTLLCEVA